MGLISAPPGAAVNGPDCHPARIYESRTNLDSDPAKEEVIASENADCGHRSWIAGVVIRDRCRGAWRTYDLGSEGNRLEQFRIVNADGRTKRREVFFVTRKFGVVWRGVAAIVRLDSRPGRCARVRMLFRYEPDAGVQTAGIQLTDAAGEYAGLEVVVTEGFEVEQRVTKYRYSRTLDRYIAYS